MALVVSQTSCFVILPSRGGPVGIGYFAIQRTSRESKVECKDDPVLRESRVRLYSAALST